MAQSSQDNQAAVMPQWSSKVVKLARDLDHGKIELVIKGGRCVRALATKSILFEEEETAPPLSK